MRVIALLLLSCVCGVLGQTATQTWQVTGANSPNSWTIDGQANPSINVTVGNLYAFNITFSNTAHPFNFSSDSNTASVVLSAIDPAFIITTTGTCTSTMASTNLFGYVATAAPTTPCTIWLNVTSGAANKTIYYRCAQHPAMVGSITAWAAAATTNTTTAPPTATPTPTPTTAANTTNAPTNSTPTATPTPTASPAPATPAPAGTVITGTTFRVIQGSATQGWLFADSNNNQFWNPTIQPTPGTNLTFSLEYTGLHPFGLSNTSATGVANTPAFFPDVLDQFITIENITGTACDQTYAGTTNTYNPIQPTSGPVIKCVIKVTVPTGMTGTAFYRCAIHNLMIGQIILGTSSTPTPTVTPTPTPTSNTTNAPTTKPNSASTISALVAIVMAMIATLFN